MGIRIIFCGAVAALCLTAAPATAALVMTTYTGTIDVTDYTGVFGGPPTTTDYLGGQFAAKFTVDDQAPETSRVTAASLRFNGVTFVLPPANLVTSANAFVGSSLAHGYGEQTGNVSENTILASLPTPLAPASPFTLGTWDGQGRISFVFSGPGYAAIGNGIALRVETTDLSAAIPEPATWAMLIMGFGAAGAMLRRALSSRPRPARAA